MLVVIPARGGSKGIPGKNIKELGGKPLIQYTIEAAQKVASNSQIIISTDSEEIKSFVESLGLGVPFLRPSELATDTSGTQEVLIHALDWYERNNPLPDKLLLLQPTSPFRNAIHINEALNLYEASLDMVVSVKETSSNPYYVLREDDENGFLVKSKDGNFQRRQDCPKVWELNGAIYIINVKSLKSQNINEFRRVKKYIMDEFSSHDIDSQLDWFIAESILKVGKL